MDRIAEMLTDPELGGELLLVGTTMAGIIDHAAASNLSIKTIHLLAYGARGRQVRIDSDVREPVPSRNGQLEWDRSRAGEVLRRDARRYEPPEVRDLYCPAPTPRKEQCGRTMTTFGLVNDWATGEKYHLGACNTHFAWLLEEQERVESLRPEVGEVLPYANTGGLLARHFPEVDWPQLWRQLDPRWREYPEREPVEPRTTPSLSLVVSDEPTASPRKQQHRNRSMYLVPNGEQ